MQLTEYQKYKIIFLYEDGNSIISISNIMNINRHTVTKWIDRYLNSDMERKVGSGRPIKRSNSTILAIQKEIKENKYITLKEIKEKLEFVNITVSISTIKNILNERGYNYINPPKLFALSEEHKVSRLKFAIKYLNFDWNDVIFSDEVSFWMSKTPSKRWFNKYIKDDNDIKFKHTSKINVWGAITVNKMFDLNLFATNMDADKYIDILNNNLLPKYSGHLYFLFDNDPKHTSVKAKKFIKNNNIKTIDFPASSPDLNPIENIWAIIKKNINKNKYNTIDEFKAGIKNIWENIGQDTIINTINSMNKRLQLIIDKKGGHIKY